MITRGLVYYFYADLNKPLLSVANLTERISGQIYNPAVNKRTPIIDLYDHTPVVMKVCHPDLSAKG